MAGPANKSSQLIDERRVRLAERGIAEMTVDLYRSFAEPLSDETLFRWHRIVMSGSRGLRDVGHYRSGAEPMQVVSGPIGVPRVHFEARPSSGVPSEMERFISWFGRTAHGRGEPLSALTRGIAHLHFEASIRLRTATDASACGRLDYFDADSVFSGNCSVTLERRISLIIFNPSSVERMVIAGRLALLWLTTFAGIETTCFLP